MSVVSVHIADVGLPKSLGFIRHPRPASISGLLHANAGVAATFGTTPARPSPGRVGLIAFWQDAVSDEYLADIAGSSRAGMSVESLMGQRQRARSEAAQDRCAGTTAQPVERLVGRR